MMSEGWCAGAGNLGSMMASSNNTLDNMRALGSISSGGVVPAAMQLAQRGAMAGYPAAMLQQQYLSSIPWLLRMQARTLFYLICDTLLQGVADAGVGSNDGYPASDIQRLDGCKGVGACGTWQGCLAEKRLVRHSMRHILVEHWRTCQQATSFTM